MSLLSTLPNDLPIPVDDGAADHLTGLSLPSISLNATNGTQIDLSRHKSEWLVLYVYPMTGRPDHDLPAGWNQVPGARGCTPQSCAFRDHHGSLRARKAEVVGLSVQSTEYQREMVERLHLPYLVVSDADQKFGDALNLPTMSIEMAKGRVTHLYKRLTLIVKEGQIQHVMYPVFPPDQNAQDVENWLRDV